MKKDAKESFDPQDWLPLNNKVIENNSDVPAKLNDSQVPSDAESSDQVNDIELIISRLELSAIDITANYNDWCEIGFALVDGLGESGRAYFHRVSKFYPGYSVEECNKQYDKCLNSNGNGITLATLLYHIKQAGIDIQTRKANHEEVVDSPCSSVITPDELLENDEGRVFNTPQLPTEIYSDLPELLSESADLFQDGVEKDVFLIGAIAVLSGCLPNIQGVYFDESYTPHLYVFITGPAGSGKGKMKWSKYFGLAIHDQIIRQSEDEKLQYELALEEYNNLPKNERQEVMPPEVPGTKMFFIPANCSASAFIQALANNNFKGVLFETEADTLANSFKQEWGNFSDILNKAFHHENTSMYRKKDSEYIEIRDPHIAIVLSGTPRQVHHLMPDTENGLFSRFLYYCLNDKSEFKNPFVSHRPVNYEEFFRDKSMVILDLYERLNSLDKPIVFKLTEQQSQLFTEQFNAMLSRNRLLLSGELDANVKRLGLITFRIAMIFSTLRILETGDLSSPMICSDNDFNSAMSIAATLEKHAVAVFRNLPNTNLKGTKLRFFENLPSHFDRQGYLKVAKEMGLNEKTAEKYIKQFQPELLSHEHNHYTKLSAAS